VKGKDEWYFTCVDIHTVHCSHKQNIRARTSAADLREAINIRDNDKDIKIIKEKHPKKGTFYDYIWHCAV